jgi:hypothetical protein
VTSPVTRLTIRRPKTNRSRKHVKAISHFANIATTSIAKRSSTTLGCSGALCNPFQPTKAATEKQAIRNNAFCILHRTVQRVKFLIRSLSPHWHTALLAKAHSEPALNVAGGAENIVGIPVDRMKWVVHPKKPARDSRKCSIRRLRHTFEAVISRFNRGIEEGRRGVR